MEITDATLSAAEKSCIINWIVQDDPTAAQITYDLTLIMSLVLCMVFLPFLTFLVYIQTQNFMDNTTTNQRYSKNKRANVSEDNIARIAEYSSGDETGIDDTTMTPYQTPPGMRSSNMRKSVELRHHNDGCLANCGSMFCSPSHFNKQERLVKKFVRNPNAHTNQEHDHDLLEGQYSMTMSESYGRRKMYTYALANEAPYHATQLLGQPSQEI